MKHKVPLDKQKIVAFLGSMNAMPMMYAIELRKMGYDVLYFVDASQSNALCRPEKHYPEISYPYPPWIVEFRLPSQLLLALFPRIFAGIFRYLIKIKTRKDVGCYFLNGFFVSIAPFLQLDAIKIGLSHGSDLDVWANVEKAKDLARSFSHRSIFKYLPSRISNYLINKIVINQFDGYVKSKCVLYFPLDFNKEGRRVVEKIVSSGGNYVSRYDASFVQLGHKFKNHVSERRPLIIFSLVRFLYRTFPEGNVGYNKGNDIIIEGLAKYKKINPNIMIHFVEKGEDVDYAKCLCSELEIDDIVVWHKEMPFDLLIENILRSDICIDQVGDHWIGAGVYAMWLGLPLIANADHACRAGIWPLDNPVLNSRDSDEVCSALQEMAEASNRAAVGQRSREFVAEYLNPVKTLRSVFEFDVL